MDDLTNVTLDMLINIYKTSLDYLTNGPLREEFKKKKDWKEWHRTYLGFNPPYPPN